MEALILILLLANLALVAYFFLRPRGEEKPSDSLIMLQNQIQDLSRGLDQKLGDGTSRMFESMKSQFGESQRLAADIRDLVAKQLTEVKVEQTKTNEATSRFMTI